MKVLAFMKYGSQAASARQRLMQFAPYLGEHGLELEYLPLLGNDHMRRVAAGTGAALVPTLAAYARRLLGLLTRRDFDVLWVQYELFPYLPGLFERLARLSGKPIVVDYDDAIFHMYDAHRRSAVRAALGTKLAPLLSRADTVICGNAYIEAYASRYCARTPIIPTVVDTSVFRPREYPRPDGPVVVGWIGSPSTWAIVEPLLPRLLPVLAREGAIMRVVGAGPRAENLPGVDARAWSEATEVADLQSMDVGIMPVEDEPWQRGKCGYKLIQYMACGLPVIGSPVGVNSDIVTSEVGLLADTPDQWEDALIRLIRNAALRRDMGIRGRARAEAHYSLASQAPRLLGVLQAAASRSRPQAKPGT